MGSWTTETITPPVKLSGLWNFDCLHPLSTSAQQLLPFYNLFTPLTSWTHLLPIALITSVWCLVQLALPDAPEEWGSGRGCLFFSFLSAGDWSLGWLVRSVASTTVLTSYSPACSCTFLHNRLDMRTSLLELCWSQVTLSCSWCLLIDEFGGVDAIKHTSHS